MLTRLSLSPLLVLALLAPLAFGADNDGGTFPPASVTILLGDDAPAGGIGRAMSHDRLSRVIVEFTTPPSAVSGASSNAASARRDLFDRFRADLARIDGNSIGKRVEQSRVIREYSVVFSGAAVTTDRGSIDALKRLPYVKRVVADTAVRASFEPGIVAVGANQVWSGFGTRGAGVTVAILDSGIDYTHPALGAGIGPGFKVLGGWDFVNDDEDPMDDNGHGTHVAGIVAANSSDLLGVAPEASLIAFKVLDDDLQGSESDIIAAIERCADPNGDSDPSDRVQVVNLSLGGSGAPDDPQSLAVNTASQLGITFCIAAGNRGAWQSITSPGTAADAITVGAADGEGNLASFSSRGPVAGDYSNKPDIVAPGVDVRSTWLYGTTASLQGTSMATPHVAGVAALLRALHPGWTTRQIKAAIVTTARPLDGNTMASGGGFVDAVRASLVGTFVEPASLNFGIADTAVGRWSSRRWLTVFNSADEARNYEVVAGGTIPGLAITINTSSFTLQPGGSRDVELTARVENGQLGFPGDNSLSFTGFVTIDDGVQSVNVSWALIKGLYVRLDWVGSENVIAIFGAAGGKSDYMPAIGERAFETLVLPGNYNVTAIAAPTDGGAPSLVTFEGIRIIGDEVLVASRENAPYTLTFRATDEHNLRFGAESGPLEGCSQDRLILLPGSPTPVIRVSESGSPNIRTSALSDRFYIVGAELCADAASQRFYSMQYETIQGVTSSRRLDAGGSDLVAQPIDLRLPFINDTTTTYTFEGELHSNGIPLPVFASHSFTRSSSLWNGTLFLGSSPDPRFEYLTRIIAESFEGETSVQKLKSSVIRRGDHGVTCFDGTTPPPTAYKSGLGESLVLGSGAMTPILTFDVAESVVARISYVGGLDERVVPSSSSITLRARTGTVLATGHDAVVVPNVLEGPVLIMKARGQQVDGFISNLTTTSKFQSTGNDPYPPSLTSMNIVDGAGTRLLDRASRGSAPRLRFSAIDGLEEPASARVRFRLAGTAPWTECPVSIVGLDYGGAELGHVQRGTIYEAGLSGLAAAEGRYELDIIVTDSQGNTTEASIAPAIEVVEPRKHPVRR